MRTAEEGLRLLRHAPAKAPGNSNDQQLPRCPLAPSAMIARRLKMPEMADEAR